MKRYKLKKEVKQLLLTILIVIIGIGVYIGVGNISHLVKDNSLYQFLVILGWSWLVLFQNIILAMIWDF